MIGVTRGLEFNSPFDGSGYRDAFTLVHVMRFLESGIGADGQSIAAAKYSTSSSAAAKPGAREVDCGATFFKPTDKLFKCIYAWMTAVQVVGRVRMPKNQLSLERGSREVEEGCLLGDLGVRGVYSQEYRTSRARAGPLCEMR